MQAEFGEAEIPMLLVFARLPEAAPVRPTCRAIGINGVGAEIGFEFMQRWLRPPNKIEQGWIDHKIGESAICEIRHHAAGQHQRLHRPLSPHSQNKMGAGDVGNSTSSAPACRHIKSKTSLLGGLLAV